MLMFRLWAGTVGIHPAWSHDWKKHIKN